MQKIFATFMLALLLCFVITSINGSSLYVTEPYNATLNNNGSTYLGKVGPGQSFYLVAKSSTENASGVTVIKGWNRLYVSNLPAGWLATNSSLYGSDLSISITPAPNASGIYSFKVTAVNIGNYSKIGSISFTAYVNVTPDVFSIRVFPTHLVASPGAPAYFNITINNTGLSDSPFGIQVSGLPSFHTTTQEVIAMHGTSKTVRYELYENEPGIYHATVKVESIASSEISKEANITFTVKPTFKGDISALSYGGLIFPIIYEPVYAVLYLISLL